MGRLFPSAKIWLNTSGVKTITPTKEAPRIAEVIKPLVSSKVIGRTVGVHHRTIELHAQKGLLPHYRVGGSLRFDLDEVMAAMRKEAGR